MVFRQFLRGRFSQSAPAQPAFLLAQILLVLAGGLVFYGCNNSETAALNVSGTVTGLAAGTHVTLSDSVAQRLGHRRQRLIRLSLHRWEHGMYAVSVIGPNPFWRLRLLGRAKRQRNGAIRRTDQYHGRLRTRQHDRRRLVRARQGRLGHPRGGQRPIN